KLVYEFLNYLCKITGMFTATAHPEAGAHGELTGLKVIRRAHIAHGHSERNLIITADSSHGTNPASVRMAGMDILEIPSNKYGMIDVDAFKKAVEENKERFAGCMLTIPNTLGIFEPNIPKICSITHEYGGYVYMDGANLNALIGEIRVRDLGVDVVHFNLHKTFATPHGGGGPGAGPIAVIRELGKYLPVPRIRYNKKNDYYWLDWKSQDAVSTKVCPFYGPYGVVIKANAYRLALGEKGMRRVSEIAILNANYMLSRIMKEAVDKEGEPLFKVLYAPGQFCMHEFVISSERFAQQHGLSAIDFAKGIIDYGMYAPTVGFPLVIPEHGSNAIMVEPTETATLEGMDYFCEIFVKLAKDAWENPEILRNAPSCLPFKRIDILEADRRKEVRSEDIKSLLSDYSPISGGEIKTVVSIIQGEEKKRITQKPGIDIPPIPKDIDPHQLKFTDGGEWVYDLGKNFALCGISKEAAKILDKHGIVGITFPSVAEQEDEVGTTIIQNEDSSLSIEQDKASIQIIAPVSGEIVAINPEMLEAKDLKLILEKPYPQGWLFIVQMSDPNELNNTEVLNNHPAGIIPALSWLLIKLGISLRHQTWIEQIAFWTMNLVLVLVLDNLLATIVTWSIFFFLHFVRTKNMPQAPPCFGIVFVTLINIIFASTGLSLTFPFLISAFILSTLIHHILNIQSIKIKENRRRVGSHHHTKIEVNNKAKSSLLNLSSSEHHPLNWLLRIIFLPRAIIHELGHLVLYHYVNWQEFKPYHLFYQVPLRENAPYLGYFLGPVFNCLVFVILLSILGLNHSNIMLAWIIISNLIIFSWEFVISFINKGDLREFEQETTVKEINPKDNARDVLEHLIKNMGLEKILSSSQLETIRHNFENIEFVLGDGCFYSGQNYLKPTIHIFDENDALDYASELGHWLHHQLMILREISDYSKVDSSLKELFDWLAKLLIDERYTLMIMSRDSINPIVFAVDYVVRLLKWLFPKLNIQRDPYLLSAKLICKWRGYKLEDILGKLKEYVNKREEISQDFQQILFIKEKILSSLNPLPEKTTNPEGFCNNLDEEAISSIERAIEEKKFVEIFNDYWKSVKELAEIKGVEVKFYALNPQFEKAPSTFVYKKFNKGVLKVYLSEVMKKYLDKYLTDNIPIALTAIAKHEYAEVCGNSHQEAIEQQKKVKGYDKVKENIERLQI
ncbi:MAG: aminotransferase class V-fold PLP-dependent enzyme, partial [Candidatus Omnitrophica bacterium]|nr:aminotransferase class V-fold PLP-dependent enzyme [Candidatus Omnitrophota bacterium]